MSMVLEDVWVCQSCGDTNTLVLAPKRCPTCREIRFSGSKLEQDGTVRPLSQPETNRRSDLDAVWPGQYLALQKLPFESVRALGHGGFAQVDAFKMTDGPMRGKILARKVIRATGPQSQQGKQSVRNEIDLMKKLRHTHIVSFTFTYEQSLSRGKGLIFGIVIGTVADIDLAEYLDDMEDSIKNGGDPAWLLETQTASTYGTMYTPQAKYRRLGH
ncbi:hypothetical protein BU16DRAFT_618132 [Lophium mytilinum]|uniref:Protein kinase domain-containing protein n=1 Tax=Lophium mytilinum TaxID=390894 RepID=A0A6A6QT43_9PEZI|nr:hypothetical protein BU16DRAFT_618132 [Lophium mytilinum]